MRVPSTKGTDQKSRKESEKQLSTNHGWDDLYSGNSKQRTAQRSERREDNPKLERIRRRKKETEN